MLRLSRRAQSTAEYAIVIGLVIAAVVGMQVYVRRGLQARTQGAMQYMINQTATELGTNPQFEPLETEREVSQTSRRPIHEQLSSAPGTEGQVVRTIEGQEDTSATGFERFDYEAPPQP